MKKRKKHTPEQIVAKLRDADVMLNSGKDIAAVLQSLEICEATYQRWRAQYDGMKSDEAKRLKVLEIENSRLKRLLADAELDKAMLKEAFRGNGLARRGNEKLFSEFKKSLKYLNVGHAVDWDFVAALCVTSVECVQTSLSFANVFWSSFDSDRDLAIDVSLSCFERKGSELVTSVCIEYGVKKD
jgi:hypothetical protein